MFFFIAGNTRKQVGREQVRIPRNGNQVIAEVTVFKSYITLFFIPLIPIGKSYSIYIPHTDEYYQNGSFSKMPADLLEICKDVGRKY